MSETGNERFLLVVLCAAKPGREQEFTRWYDQVHIPDVLTAVDGVVSAERFEFADTQGSDPPDFPYLALYEVRARDLPSMQRAFERAATTWSAQPGLHRTDSRADFRAWYFTPIGG